MERASSVEGEGPNVRRDDPLAPDVLHLIQRHLALVRAAAPPESTHALEPAELAAPGVLFFSLREGDALLGMGALSPIGPDHAEIKSMHVAAEARGRGLARLLLARLMEEARAAGLTRLSLETGAQPVFAPARALYAAAGFAECPPFGNYAPDPNSVFMTLAR